MTGYPRRKKENVMFTESRKHLLPLLLCVMGEVGGCPPGPLSLLLVVRVVGRVIVLN